MNATLRPEIEDFLFHESWLLDRGELTAWLDLFTDDVRYFAPVRAEMARGKEDMSQPRMLAHFDENKGGLTIRVRRLLGNYAHSEFPPSRVRRLVSNVRILEEGKDEVEITSNFIYFQSRLQDSHIHAGRRDDRLRRTGEGWRICRRQITFDHVVVPSLTILF